MIFQINLTTAKNVNDTGLDSDRTTSLTLHDVSCVMTLRLDHMPPPMTTLTRSLRGTRNARNTRSRRRNDVKIAGFMTRLLCVVELQSSARRNMSGEYAIQSDTIHGYVRTAADVRAIESARSVGRVAVRSTAS